MRPDLDLFIAGVPEPKGSHQAFVVNGKAIVTETSRGARAWQLVVAQVLNASWRRPPLRGPVQVKLLFHRIKPKSTPKKKRFPTTRPDVDKLARAVLDGMTGIVFADDAQVVDLQVGKLFSERSGVAIGVWDLAAAEQAASRANDRSPRARRQRRAAAG